MTSISGPMSTRKTGLLYVIILLLIIASGGFMFTGGMQVPTQNAVHASPPTLASQQAEVFSASVSPSVSPTIIPRQ